MKKQETSQPVIGAGVYTIPDAGKILGIPLHRMRRWLGGYLKDAERVLPLGELQSWGQGQERGFNFYTLIELFSVFQFREHGVALKTIREARAELSDRLNSHYPFAHQGVVSDGKRLLYELQEGTPEAMLELGGTGQTAFREIMEPFCHRLDFHTSTRLAERYWPNGRKSSVVVDPHHSFGRPSISGTNIATESINSLLSAGESVEDVAEMYGLEVNQVQEAKEFEHQLAAA